MRFNRGMSLRSEEFERARRETVRYHEELYAAAELGDAGTWLAQPHPLLFDALELLPADRPLVAYDLGAGIGRHTIPMLRLLPPGSQVYAVDLLPSALDQLEQQVPAGTTTALHTRAVDLVDFELTAPADLVFAFSAIEHLPSAAAVRTLLQRIAAALNPGGVVALGIIADRFEIRGDGTRRPALLESELSIEAARELLGETFADLTVEQLHLRPADVREERDGESYTLAATLLTFLATA